MDDTDLLNASAANERARAMTNADLADALIDMLMKPELSNQWEKVSFTFEAARRLR